MKTQIWKLAIAVLLIGTLVPAHAQISKVAQTGLQFLKVEMSPRAAALGGAYTLIGNDATAMFANPAGLALSENRIDVFVGYVPWIADINYNAIAAKADLGNIGTIGVHYIGTDYGDDIIGTRWSSATDAGFIETGTVNVTAGALGVAYARSLTDKFSIGGQVKHTFQSLGENLFADSTTVKNEVSGLAYDFGTIFYPGYKSLRFGMSIRNFAADFKYQEDSFSLPLTFRMGMAMDVLDFMGDHSNQLLVAVDAIHPRDFTERLNLGAEYILNNMFAFRVGYRVNYDLEGLTAGFGANLNLGPTRLRLDLAYADMGIFGSSNRMAVGFAF